MTLIIQVIVPDESYPQAILDAEAQGLTVETYIRNALMAAWHSAKECPRCKGEINHEMFKHIWEKETKDGD